MAQKESQKSRELKNLLRVKGFFSYKTHGSAETMSGIPDIIACKNGRFVAIEVKMLATKNTKFKYTEKQKIMMGELRKHGALVIGAGCLKDERKLWVIDTGEFTMNPLPLSDLVNWITTETSKGIKSTFGQV